MTTGGGPVPAEDDARAALSAYLDGEVSAEERSALEDRLADDPDWRRELDEITVVRDLLRAHAVVEPPAGSLEAITAAVAAADADDAGRERSTGGPAPVVDLAARRRSRGRIAAWAGGAVAAAAMAVAVVVPATPTVQPDVAAAVRTHAARSSVDEPAAPKLSESAVRAGFLR